MTMLWFNFILVLILFPFGLDYGNGNKISTRGKVEPQQAIFTKFWQKLNLIRLD